MSHVLDIYLNPRKVFTEIKHRPTFLIPLGIMAVLAVSMTIYYFTKVDPVWFIDNSIAASGREMTASQIATAREMMPSAGVMGYITSAIAPLVIIFMALFYALYLFVAGKALGILISFKQSLSLTAWASMPQALGSIISIIAITTMSPQTTLDSLMLTNVDPLLIELPQNHPWGALARSFSLLTIWNIALVALGWRSEEKSGWTQALVVAALPAIVIYGCMAAYAAIK